MGLLSKDFTLHYIFFVYTMACNIALKEQHFVEVNKKKNPPFKNDYAHVLEYPRLMQHPQILKCTHG